MAKSAPRISFTSYSIDYGTIDVGNSSAESSYSIYNAADVSFAHAINMSISFKDSTNSTEAGDEEWVWVSTASGAYDSIGSVGTGSENYVGSITSEAAGSAVVKTKVKVPAGATTAGRVAFLLHHRYQYTG